MERSNAKRNIKILLSILALMVVCVGCGEKPKKDEVNGKEITEADEKVEATDSQLFVSKAYYDNYGDGQVLKYETPYKDGKPHGVRKGYHKNGQLMLVEPYKDGKENGLWKHYYKTGWLEKETLYEDGKKFSEKHYPENEEKK